VNPHVFDELLPGPPPLDPTVKGMLVIWCLILVPWFPVFTIMGSGMAFEGGSVLGGYIFVIIAWAYPVFVGIAFLFRRRRPKLIWLPAIPLVAVIGIGVSALASF